MQTEKEYLTEVSNLLDAIRRAPDEHRKDVMRKMLHGKLYIQKYRYGFRSIEQVRQSIDYMNAGKPDPTRNQRCMDLKRAMDRIKTVVSDMEMSMGRATVPGKEIEPSMERTPEPFSWQKYRDLEKNSPMPDDREIDEDLERD